jgi:hypothetical protein
MAIPILKASKAQCASEWQGRLERHAASGQTVAVFCKGESFTESQFYRWRALLRSRNNQVIEIRKAPSKPAPFIDLGAAKVTHPGAATSRVDGGLNAAPGSVEVHLDLGHGLMLHIVRH